MLPLLLYTGASLLSCSVYFRHLYSLPGNDMAVKTLIYTLIGAAILESGHPYIWATLLQAHNAVHCIMGSW